MTKTLTEVSSHPTAVVVPSTGEDVTSQSVEVPFQSLTNRTNYADDRITEIQTARMAADWRRIVEPFASSSPEEVSYNSGNNTWLFPCRSDTVAVALGFPVSAQPVTLTTAGGKSGIARLVIEDSSAGLSMLTVDSNTTAATDPDIWTYDGADFTRAALSPFASTTQFRTGAAFPSLTRWVYLGSDGSPAVPSAYTSDDEGGTWTARTIAANSSERVFSSAYDASATRLVAVGTTSAGTNNTAWRTTDGITYTAATLAGTNNVQFVTHSSEAGLFMLTSIASNIITTYTSADGATWTQGGSLTTLCTNVLGLAVDSGYGGADWRILAQASDHGVTIFRSTNNGTTWLPFNTVARSGGVSPGTAGAPVFKHLAGHWVCALNDGSDGAVLMSSEARIIPQAT